MAVKLRLMRMGKTKQPTYRVVAADSRSPRDGRFIEIIGTYEPRQDPSRVNIDGDKALGYLRNGAQPTDRVKKLLTQTGTWATPPPGPPPAAVAASGSGSGSGSRLLMPAWSCLPRRWPRCRSGSAAS